MLIKPKPYIRVAPQSWNYAFFSLLLASVATVASAADITVTTTVDDTAINGNCTLREAIVAANSDATVDACNSGSGNDAIILASGTYTLAIMGNNEDASFAGDLDITANLTLSGAGPDNTVIDGGAIDTVISVDPADAGIDVTIRELTIRNGKTPTTGTSLFFAGGGIRNFGKLTLDNTIVSNNTAAVGGGIFSNGELILFRTTVAENLANNSGGGLSNNLGSAFLEESSVVDNFAMGSGGGIDNNGDLTLVRVNIEGNTAQSRGGGINSEGTIIANGSLIANNSGGNGGGIFSIIASLILTNVTVSGNQDILQSFGGGIESNTGSANQETTLILNNVTITDNQDGGLLLIGSNHITEVHNTIIANNTGNDCDFFQISLNSLGHNLDSDGTCITNGLNGDITRSIPGLGVLNDNGGFTQTHALLSDSPAIDAGSNVDCPSEDQRGIARPQDGDGDGLTVCDIGSFELQQFIILKDDFEN